MRSLKRTGRAGRIGGLLFILLSAAALATTEASAQTRTTLYSFTGSDGAHPYAGLIADASGNLYGTTYYGGANGYGTVFKLALLATFNGIPGQPNCVGQSLFFLAQQYGGLARATTFGYASVTALQNAVAAHCSGS